MVRMLGLEPRIKESKSPGLPISLHPKYEGYSIPTNDSVTLVVPDTTQLSLSFLFFEKKGIVASTDANVIYIPRQLRRSADLILAFHLMQD